jgi:hypothetical protein
VEHTFFEVVPRIESSCLNLISDRKIEHVLLVGGFGESPYLRRRLKETFAKKGVKIVTVDEPTKKAAAEGTALWYIKKLVVARAVRSTFGVEVRRRYDPNSALHLERKHKVYVAEDGIKRIDGFFDTWVKKGSVIGEEASKIFDYQQLYKELDASVLGDSTVKIYAYDGEGTPDWCHDEHGYMLPDFRHVCTLQADLSGLEKFMRVQYGPQGERFWRTSYNINVRFGGTAIKARKTWSEGGILREGPVSVIPNSVY